MSNLNKSTNLLLVAFGASPVTLSKNEPKELCSYVASLAGFVSLSKEFGCGRAAPFSMKLFQQEKDVGMVEKGVLTFADRDLVTPGPIL